MKQSQWIKQILKKRPSGFDPYVVQHYQTEEGLKFGAWTQYQGQKEIDERSVLPNEIVIDIDTETTEKAAEENNRVTTFLDNNGWDYVLADTGGTGYHIHIFFKYEGLDAEDYKDYREALFTYLKEKCAEEVNAETSLWDAHPVQFDISSSKGHLVRAVGGRKKESENRKTRVLPSELGKDKEEIKDAENVEYPERIPWSLKISKTGTNKADLSIQEINEYVEEVQDKREKQHQGQTTEATLNEPVRGLQEARDIPASKVLRALDKDFKLKTNFECPFHPDSNPSANLHKENGVERLYCFSNSCAENRPPKVWNAIDILEEEGYNFQEAIEFLESHFDVEVQIGYNPHDYFSDNVKGNYTFDAQKMADEILETHKIVSIVGKDKGLRVYKDGIWKSHQESVEIIEREVNRRLQQETGRNYRANTKNIIQRREEVQIDEEEFDHPNYLIPYDNGVYNLETENLEEYKPEHYFKFKYDAEYRPELEKSSINEFLEDVAPESEEKRNQLKEIAALSMAPWKEVDIMPVLFGKGSNGKGQFVKIIKKILGKGNYHITSSERHSQDKFESASMQDKQMVFFDEFGKATNPDKIKRLTEEESNVRQMREESQTVENSFLPIFAANNLPNVNDSSEGFYRRWQIIDFMQKFTHADDGNPDKISKEKLEDKYMNKEDIDAFATDLIPHLQRVIETNQITNQQTQQEVRVMWEEKASAVYRFIDQHFTQGDINYTDDKVSDDYIIKSELTKIVNNYLDEHNISKTDTSHITRILEKHPDLEVNTSVRPSTGDGLTPDRPTAYEGIRIKEESVHAVRGVLGVHPWRSPNIQGLTKYRGYLDLEDKNKTAIALYYLENHSKDSVGLVELIKELNLSEEELQDINQSDYIVIDKDELGGAFAPRYSTDSDKIEEDLPSDDIIKDKAGRTLRPLDWVRSEIESWSNETQVDIDELVTKGSNVGFDESSIEKAVQKLEDEAKIHEPVPGRVQKL